MFMPQMMPMLWMFTITMLLFFLGVTFSLMPKTNYIKSETKSMSEKTKSLKW